eukprot:2554758-Rhodomonas_salina.1
MDDITETYDNTTFPKAFKKMQEVYTQCERLIKPHENDQLHTEGPVVHYKEHALSAWRQTIKYIRDIFQLKIFFETAPVEEQDWHYMTVQMRHIKSEMETVLGFFNHEFQLQLQKLQICYNLLKDKMLNEDHP